MCGNNNPIRYSAEEHLSIKEHSAVKSINFVKSLNQCISSEIIHRKRMKRTGIKVKIKNRSYKIPFPTINFGNVRSIRDESKQVQLHSNIRFIHQFKNMCVLALTKTWLEESDPIFTICYMLN